MRLSLIIASTAVVLASANPTAAAAADQTWRLGNQAFNVHFDDLNLDAAAGRAKALARVEAAAGRLCRDAGVRTAREKCAADAVRQASQGAAVLRMALAERAQSTIWLAQSR